MNGKRSHDNVKSTVIEGALEPWFRGRRMASISTADIRAYVADRQGSGYANSTINRELAALKRMYSLAIQAGKLLQRLHIPMLQERNVNADGSGVTVDPIDDLHPDTLYLLDALSEDLALLFALGGETVH